MVKERLCMGCKKSLEEHEHYEDAGGNGYCLNFKLNVEAIADSFLEDE